MSPVSQHAVSTIRVSGWIKIALHGPDDPFPDGNGTDRNGPRGDQPPKLLRKRYDNLMKNVRPLRRNPGSTCPVKGLLPL